jgi:hypothetical protein
MPLAVQTYEYFLHQIFSLMRTEAHANEARASDRRRAVATSLSMRSSDGLATPFGAHGL